MAGEPHKIRQHRERERVLALSHLFDPDPENPDEICEALRNAPLPEGLSCRVDAAQEFLRFLKSEFSDVQRLAASALGKMAPEKPAAETVAAIEEAAKRKASLAHQWCSRCRHIISEAEFRNSVDRWGKPYCRHCSDERELEGKNFEATVENAKLRRTGGGTAVQSIGEKRIAEFLEREGIAFIYDERFRIAEGDLIRPDFYLPEFDLYIEYFGMDTPDYLARAEKKRILYQRVGKKLISLSYRDDAHLIETLREKLSRHFRIGES